MTLRRWQVVSGIGAVALVIVGLMAGLRRRHPVQPARPDAAVPVDGGARPDGSAPSYKVGGAVIDQRGNRVVGALVTVLAAHSEAALAAGARAVWRQQGELGVYSGPLPSARVAAKMPSAVAWSAKT